MSKPSAFRLYWIQISAQRDAGVLAHYVYVARQATTVLYVGYTTNLKVRMSAHKAKAGWWDRQDNLRYTRLPNAAVGRTYESKLIDELEPEYNIAQVNDDLAMLSFDASALVWRTYRLRARRAKRPTYRTVQPPQKQWVTLGTGGFTAEEKVCLNLMRDRSEALFTFLNTHRDRIRPIGYTEYRFEADPYAGFEQARTETYYLVEIAGEDVPQLHLYSHDSYITSLGSIETKVPWVPQYPGYSYLCIEIDHVFTYTSKFNAFYVSQLDRLFSILGVEPFYRVEQLPARLNFALPVALEQFFTPVQQPYALELIDRIGWGDLYHYHGHFGQLAKLRGKNDSSQYKEVARKLAKYGLIDEPEKGSADPYQLNRRQFIRCFGYIPRKRVSKSPELQEAVN